MYWLGFRDEDLNPESEKTRGILEKIGKTFEVELGKCVEVKVTGKVDKRAKCLATGEISVACVYNGSIYYHIWYRELTWISKGRRVWLYYKVEKKK